MSNHTDNANNKIYRTIAAGLAAARRAPAMLPDCRCHFCDEVVMFGRVFRNADCRDDFERGLTARKRSGEYFQDSPLRVRLLNLNRWERMSEVPRGSILNALMRLHLWNPFGAQPSTR